MRALVVYESMYGNTRDVATAIAEGVGRVAAVDLCEVGAAPTEVGEAIDLVVVGGPTHAFSMSRDGTRADAAKNEPNLRIVSTGIGIREWLDRVRVLGSPGVATFDTKVIRPRLPGSAAGAARKRVRHLSFELVADPESFWVEGGPGPLTAGEAERAAAWGESVARAAAGADQRR